MGDNENDEEVGYGRPPKRKQFQKGESGNPSGRPKGSKNIATLINEVCLAPVRVKGEDGRQYQMPTIEAIMKRVVNAAAKGDMKASRIIFEILKMFPAVMEAPPLALPSVHVHFVDAENGRPKMKKDSSALEGQDEGKVEVSLEGSVDLHRRKKTEIQ